MNDQPRHVHRDVRGLEQLGYELGLPFTRKFYENQVAFGGLAWRRALRRIVGRDLLAAWSFSLAWQLDLLAHGEDLPFVNYDWSRVISFARHARVSETAATVERFLADLKDPGVEVADSVERFLAGLKDLEVRP